MNFKEDLNIVISEKNYKLEEIVGYLNDTTAQNLHENAHFNEAENQLLKMFGMIMNQNTEGF